MFDSSCMQEDLESKHTTGQALVLQVVPTRDFSRKEAQYINNTEHKYSLMEHHATVVASM